MKLWEKKYQLNKQIENYTVGNDYLLDQKLLKYDCQASIAHAKMLNKIGILTKEECDKIIMILYEIIKIDNNGSFVIEQILSCIKTYSYSDFDLQHVVRQQGFH